MMTKEEQDKIAEEAMQLAQAFMKENPSFEGSPISLAEAFLADKGEITLVHVVSFGKLIYDTAMIQSAKHIAEIFNEMTDILPSDDEPSSTHNRQQ